jgi:hypothetical protein
VEVAGRGPSVYAVTCAASVSAPFLCYRSFACPIAASVLR